MDESTARRTPGTEPATAVAEIATPVIPAQGGPAQGGPAQGGPDRAARSYRPRHRADEPARYLDADPRAGMVERSYRSPLWMSEEAAVEITPRRPRALPEDQPGFVRPAGLVEHARWTTPRSGAFALTTLLLGALAAAAATATGLLQRQSTPTLALVLVLVLAAAGINAVMVAVRPTVVEIDEAWLTVRHAGRTDRFDLSDPYQRLRVTGEPGTVSWTLDLGCPDEHVVRVTGAMADSTALALVVAYAQQYAERDRAARLDRFSR